MAATTAVTADKERGTATVSTNNFSLKSTVTEDGQERDFIQGFLATTHQDKGNDRFTEEALQQMAEDIKEANVDAVFNDVDMDALEEAQVGNIDHNNNPASPFGDVRTVPAFKTVEAEVRQTDDGEKGLWIKAVLNSDGMLSDTVSAVKNSIRDNFLSAFSIEFVPEKVRQITEGERVVRVIEAAKAKGAALTGRPMNPNAVMTAADLKSVATEYTDEAELEIKVDDPVIQTPEYTATSEGSWEKPAAGDFPDDYNTNTIFIVKEKGSDNFSDHALPVVDWRDGEATLVLEGLRSAHTTAAQVDGLDEDTVSRARNKIESLASEAFDVDLGDSKTDVRTMSEEDNEVPEEESQPEQPEEETKAEEEVDEESEGQEEDGGEEKSFTDEVQEIRDTVEEVKTVNEELREENEELKSELEDLRQLQEIKSEVDEVKQLLEEVDLEDGPRAKPEQKRFDDSDNKAEWKQRADRVGADFFKGEGYNKSNIEAFAENHGIDVEEVKNYVNRD